jgi:uncharacterized membrane protein
LRRRCDLCYFCALIVKHNYSRNSISPAAFAGALALLAVVTLAIGVGFALVGAWLVLPFAGGAGARRGVPVPRAASREERRTASLKVKGK